MFVVLEFGIINSPHKIYLYSSAIIFSYSLRGGLLSKKNVQLKNLIFAKKKKTDERTKHFQI